MADVKFSYKSGTSFARGITIDGWLEDDETLILYEKWQDSWPVPLMYHGGIRVITCEKVKQVDPKELKRVYGRKLGAKLIEVSERHAVLS